MKYGVKWTAMGPYGLKLAVVKGMAPTNHITGINRPKNQIKTHKIVYFLGFPGIRKHFPLFYVTPIGL